MVRVEVIFRLCSLSFFPLKLFLQVKKKVWLKHSYRHIWWYHSSLLAVHGPHAWVLTSREARSSVVWPWSSYVTLPHPLPAPPTWHTHWPLQTSSRSLNKPGGCLSLPRILPLRGDRPVPRTPSFPSRVHIQVHSQTHTLGHLANSRFSKRSSNTPTLSLFFFFKHVPFSTLFYLCTGIILSARWDCF